VLIGAADVLPSLKERADIAADEVLTFTDADALRALEVITKRKPAIVAVERVFAGTPRGAALINRIKSDPSLLGSEIRVVSHDDAHAWVGPRRGPEAAGGNGATAVASAHATTAVQPLDQRGTRRAPRFRLSGEMEVLVDGNQAVLVDLSTLGAQLVSATVLKPSQRVRMALFDAKGSIRFNATVAWASFEIPPDSIPRYRAGIEFIDANPAAVDAYCARHKK
jgi:PilZ domain-containing protein